MTDTRPRGAPGGSVRLLVAGLVVFALVTADVLAGGPADPARPDGVGLGGGHRAARPRLAAARPARARPAGQLRRPRGGRADRHRVDRLDLLAGPGRCCRWARLAWLSAVTTGVVVGLKIGVDRLPPSGVRYDGLLGSYPSGHTATAIVLWGLLAAGGRRAPGRRRVRPGRPAAELGRPGAGDGRDGAAQLPLVVSDLIGGAALAVVLVQGERLALRHWRRARGPQDAGVVGAGPVRRADRGRPRPPLRRRRGCCARSGTRGSTSPAGWPPRPTGCGRRTNGGDRLRVFELDRSCRVVRVVQAGIDPYDVEDLARAADGTLWLADTGDNGLNRSTVALERIRPGGAATLFRLSYPGRAARRRGGAADPRPGSSTSPRRNR